MNNIILNEKDEQVEYRVILKINEINNKNFIVYTKDELDDNGDTITYVSEYIEQNNKIKISTIKDDEEYKMIKDILDSIQNGEK